MTGEVQNDGPDTRNTPALVQHQTDIAAVVRAVNGDHRMYNNLMVAPAAFSPFDSDYLPCFGAGNVYTGAAGGPSKYETGAIVNATFDAGVALMEEGGAWFLSLTTDPAWAAQQARELVTTGLLGNASLVHQAYTRPDNSSFAIDTDYFGKPRDPSNPFPGPFEASGSLKVQVWPKP